MSETADLPVAQSLEGASAELLNDLFAGRVLPPPVDPVEVNARITEQMLAAETPEEALRAGATIGFDELMGVPVEVRGFYFRPSTLKGDVRVYMLVDGYRLDEGEPCIITTSAVQVMRTLAVWGAKGWLPATFIVDKADTPTQDGFTPFTIRAA